VVGWGGGVGGWRAQRHREQQAQNRSGEIKMSFQGFAQGAALPARDQHRCLISDN